MSSKPLLLFVFFFFMLAVICNAQQISKEELLFLTPEWKGERFPDGRPKVPDEILKRMKLVTLEEARAVFKGANYKHALKTGGCVSIPSVFS